ncbi:MAG: hypothetical protein R2754_01770 [Microthrixaceae bacterium]
MRVLTNRQRENISNQQEPHGYLPCLTDIIEEEAPEEMLSTFQPESRRRTRHRPHSCAVCRDVRMAQMETCINATLDKRLTSQTRWMVSMIIAAPTVTVALQAYFT